MNAIQTTHKLSFEVGIHWTGTMLFRVGTCHGQWGSTRDSYYILSIINEVPGNGHVDDVLEWFEYSCKRDHRNLIVLHILNAGFFGHLTIKRGFQPLDKMGENVIKIFNKKAYKKLLKNGNAVLAAGTLKCK